MPYAQSTLHIILIVYVCNNDVCPLGFYRYT